MRIGQPEKVRRGQQPPVRVDAISVPKHASRGSVVGKLSGDNIAVYFGPELQARALDALENYSNEMMEYDEIVNAYKQAQAEKEENLASAETVAEAEITPDGTVIDPGLPPMPESPPKAPLFRSEKWLKELDEVLTDTTDFFQSKNGGWKVHARAARFERFMDERYGRLRPLIKQYPELEQMIRSVQRKYATGYFSPFRQGKPPIPKSTAVILLFMMQRGNLRWEVMMLAALFFLIGLQPWALVVIVAGMQQLLDNRKRRPLKPMKSFIPTTEPYYSNPDEEENDEEGGDDETFKTKKAEAAKRKLDLLKKPVGTKLDPNEKTDDLASAYDTILLGYGPDTLYLGALLSRAGRKVLVLSPREDASGCCTLDDGQKSTAGKQVSDVPFDVESSNVSKCSRQQTLLAPALCSSTDYQGGIRFAKIGEEADGYAFEILSVPGMGTERGKDGAPFVLRGDGKKSLIEDAALTLGDGWPGVTPDDTGNSATAVYLNVCEALNGTSNQFYVSKLLDDSVNSLRSASTYQEATIRYASSFLERGFPLNVHTRSLLAAVGMRGENIKPGRLSMGAHVTNVCSAMSGEGMHYPIGGPRALCHAFRAVIEENGGKILTNVPIYRLQFEKIPSTSPKPKKDNAKEGDDSTEEPSPRCIGVQLSDKRIIEFKMDQWKESYSPAVVSMIGFVNTFIRLLPDEVRTANHKVPRGLGALAERRPVMKLLFSLNGSAKDLNVTGADFYRLPAAAIAKDEMDPMSGEVKFGEIGGTSESGDHDDVEIEAINMDAGDNPQGGAEVVTATSKPKRSKRVKYETGKSWIQISFPSAKDPSFETVHGKITTCVVTVEADDDFVTMFDTKPKLYAVQKGKGETHGDYVQLVQRVQQDLLDTFPQLQGKITHCKMIGPVYRGLTHTPERYAAKGVRPETPYPGLFVGGSDLTIGESFSGSIVGAWLAANAVMDYSPLDHLFLQKNITSDLIQYMEPPDAVDEEDLAVDPDRFQYAKSDVSKEKLGFEPDLVTES
mmetsp:Transcript_27981/g.67918  ORF Transcript_27981/g.67918 Transcript_27981/m.67918 type:complete len:1011 (+) Transcript_27981:221-3253(+)